MKILILLLVVSALADTEIEEIALSTRLFSGDLYSQLLLDSDENFLISPFSAETAFAFVQSGAKEATAEEIRSVLHLPASQEQTETDIKATLSSFTSELITLVSANKIYVDNTLSVNEDFRKIAEEVYQSEFENLDFQQTADAIEQINDWVAKKTEDNIKDLLTSDDIDASTKFVLVNALFLEANWSIPFISDFTQKRTFFLNEEETVEVPTMFQESQECNYFASQDLDAQILEVPFLDEQATMTFILPNKKEGISILEKNVEEIFETPEFTKEWVQIYLPKFKIETTINFKQILQNLGVVSAFDPMEADFSGIAGEKGDLFIGQSKQKTFINVNEVGVKAAAATEMGGNDSVPPPATKFFFADHPFIFYIKVNDIILFNGRVLQPETSEN